MWRPLHPTAISLGLGEGVSAQPLSKSFRGVTHCVNSLAKVALAHSERTRRLSPAPPSLHWPPGLEWLEGTYSFACTVTQTQSLANVHLPVRLPMCVIFTLDPTGLGPCHRQHFTSAGANCCQQGCRCSLGAHSPDDEACPFVLSDATIRPESSQHYRCCLKALGIGQKLSTMPGWPTSSSMQRRSAQV